MERKVARIGGQLVADSDRLGCRRLSEASTTGLAQLTKPSVT